MSASSTRTSETHWPSDWLWKPELRHALERDQFVVYYQPFVNLETAKVTGAEALVRWQHPSRGLVPSVTFIPAMEDNGMIVQLGRWILRTACCAAASWQPSDPAQVVTIAVNVSARQLEDPGIVDNVIDALAESGLPPEVLTLEITESARLGVKIAIDDFGTGYSSCQGLVCIPSTPSRLTSASSRTSRTRPATPW